MNTGALRVIVLVKRLGGFFLYLTKYSKDYGKYGGIILFTHFALVNKNMVIVNQWMRNSINTVD